MRILVIKPSSLGDIVHAMVVISELKEQLPECIVDWVAGDQFFDIVEQSKIARKVILYERHGGLMSIFRLISEIRRETYDYVFDMQGLARSGVMTFFSKSSNKIGRRDARELAFLAYSETALYPGKVHAVDILKEFLGAVGCNNQVSGFVKELKNIDSPKYFDFLKNNIVTSKFICVFPETRGNKKRWHHFPVLTKTLLEQTKDTSVLLLGSEMSADFDIAHPFFFDLRKKTSLTDLVFLIRHANLSVANDSGPLHISAAQGRPSLGLFTVTDPSRSGPYPFHKDSNVALRLDNDLAEIDVVARTAIEMLDNLT